jgi:DNA-binding response OmpR family regulator
LPRILSVSRNPRLLATRNDALAIAGYSVASPKDPRDAIAQYARSPFDAVIIGHSVEAELRKQLIEGLRQMKPSVSIVFVHAAGADAEPLADVTVDSAEDPVAIIIALDKLLGRAGSGRP